MKAFYPELTADDLKKLEELEQRYHAAPPVETWVNPKKRILRDSYGFTEEAMQRLKESELRQHPVPIENDSRYQNPPEWYYDKGYAWWIASK